MDNQVLEEDSATQDIADAAYSLASSDGRWVTRTILYVDDGFQL